jgi:predicted permease
MAPLIPLPLRLAVRRLPADTRDEILRELLERYLHIRSSRGDAAAWRWAWRQPFATWSLARSSEGDRMWHGFIYDVMTGQRSLRRRPALAITVIITVAISVGAISAVASVIDAVLLRPLPFPDAGQLVWAGSYDRRPGAPDPSRATIQDAYANPLDVLDWRRRERHLAALAPFETFEGTVRVGERPVRINTALISPAMMDVLRIQPLYGRLFRETDRAPKPAVTVLTFEFWQSAFGGDPTAVGRTLLLNDEPVAVIGVLPDLGMKFPAENTDLWVPLAPLPADFANRGGVWQRVIARVDAGVSVEAAEADMQRVARELSDEFPDTNKDRHVMLVPLREALVGTTGAVLWLLGGAIALVLLIACANVGHLLLVSAQGRRRELAVRTALGAAPARLARLLLIESAWLSCTGGVAGLLVGSLMLKGFVALYPERLPAVGQISMGLVAFAATAAAIVLASVLSILPSLWQARGRAVQHGIRASERGSEDRAQRRVRGLLVVTQVALSTTLLIGGGLLVRSFINMTKVNPGFAPQSALTFNLALSQRKYPELQDEVHFYDEVLSRVRSLPGVSAAGTTSLLPLTPGEFGDGFYRVGKNDAAPNIPVARLQAVMPGYFEAIGLTIKGGRTLQPNDTAASMPVVVVNETLQRKFFPDGALGHQIRFRGVVREIVGIVGDKHHRSLRDTPRAEMFYPRSQVTNPRLLAWVVVRGSGDVMSLLPAVQAAVTAMDPGVALKDPRLMSDRIDRAVAPDRFRAVIIASLAVVALLLSALGLYGLIAYAVARDARDIAIRMALGASPGSTVANVVRSVLILAGTGAALGVIGAMASQRWISEFLLGVSERDPWTMTAVAGALMAVAALAAAGPARRASRVDPASVLRSQ